MTPTNFRQPGIEGKRRTLAFLIVLVMAWTAAASGGEALPDNKGVRDAMSAVYVPGVAVAVVRDGELTVHTFGSAVPGEDRPVKASTVFEAASLSKTVFATLFMDSVAAGESRLDEPLADTAYSARVVDKSQYRRLTPRLILSHQSGLPNWAGDAMDPERSDPLEFDRPPGGRFGYSGEGYELLRAHLARKSGVLLEERFARSKHRYGMPNSHYVYEETPPLAARAVGTTPAQTRGIPPVRRAIAAASLVTTAEDYGRFILFLLEHDDLLRAMLEPQVEVDAAGGERISWGLGWGVLERENGERVAFHWGDNFQFKAFVAIDPETATGVAYFANGVNGLRLVDALVEPVVGPLDAVRAWLGYED